MSTRLNLPQINKQITKEEKERLLKDKNKQLTKIVKK
jgi:hypothetical protein